MYHLIIIFIFKYFASDIFSSYDSFVMTVLRQIIIIILYPITFKCFNSFVM